MHTLLRILLLSAVTLSLGGACAKGSLVVDKPESRLVNDAITTMWANDIRRVAKSGDWILTRSYSKTGDFIVGSTRGESFSHAAVYDAERGTIIEAINPVVREVPLEDLLARNRYAVVVRPVGQGHIEGRKALGRARSALGASFDYTGLVGIDSKTRFYCSELVAWASDIEDAPRIVTPADLYERGELIYLSGARDEQQLQATALAQRRMRIRPVASVSR